MFAFISKDELKRMFKDAPSGTSPQSIINSLLEKGHSLEGYVKQGPKGEKGDRGERGFTGNPGKDGRDGQDGKDGKDGRDGRDGVNGKDGRDGVDGKDGKDGSPDTPEQILEKLITIGIPVSIIKDFPYFQNQNLGHFGHGFPPETEIVAGSNVTVTKNSFGKYVISSTATGSGGIGAWNTPAESPAADGSVTVFTVGSEAPTDVLADGVIYPSGTAWTFAGGQITISIGGVGPTSFIRYR